MINFLKWMKRHKLLTGLLILILFALPPAASYYLCGAGFYTLEMEMKDWLYYFIGFEVLLGALFAGGVSLWQAEMAKENDLLVRNTVLLEKNEKPYRSSGNLFAPITAEAIKPYVEITLRFQTAKECMPTGYILKKIDVKESLNGKSVLSGRLVYANQVINTFLTRDRAVECKIKIVDENLPKLKDELVVEGKLTFVKEADDKRIATDYEAVAAVKLLGNTQIEVTDVLLHQQRASYLLPAKRKG